jgi:hypothetical protein
MKNNVQNYLNVLKDPSDLSQNKRLELEYENVKSDISLESFKRAFMAWKKNNSSKHVKKAKVNPNKVVGAFEQIINDLVPDNNPLGLPD